MRNVTMRKLRYLTIAMLAMGAIIGGGAIEPAAAHHSFAMFDLSQHQLIEGRITEWHYNNPHSWLHVEAEDETGEMQTWSFEGAGRVHAASHGVTRNPVCTGEVGSVVD